MGLRDLEDLRRDARRQLEQAKVAESHAKLLEVIAIGSEGAAGDKYRDAVKRGDHQGATDGFTRWREAVAEKQRQQFAAMRATMRVNLAADDLREIDEALSAEMKELQRGLLDLGQSGVHGTPGSLTGDLFGSRSTGARGLLGGREGSLGSGSAGGSGGSVPGGTGSQGGTSPGLFGSPPPTTSSIGNPHESNGAAETTGSASGELTKSSESTGPATSGTVVTEFSTMHFQSWTTNENGAAIVAGLTGHSDPMSDPAGLTGNAVVDAAIMRDTRFQLGFIAPPQGPSRALRPDGSEGPGRDTSGFNPNSYDPLAPYVSPSEGYDGRTFHPPRGYRAGPMSSHYMEALYPDGAPEQYEPPAADPRAPPPGEGGDPQALVGVVVAFSAGVRSPTVNIVAGGAMRAPQRS